AGGMWDSERLFYYVPLALVSPHKHWPYNTNFAFRSWYKTSLPNVVKRIHSAGFGNVDLIYFDNALQTFWLEKVSYKKSCFRVADNSSFFPNFSKRVLEQEKLLGSSVNQVFYVTKALQDYALNLGAQSPMYLPNGVDTDFFHPDSNIPKP